MYNVHAQHEKGFEVYFETLLYLSLNAGLKMKNRGFWKVPG